jgi:GAF domain-containing protein
MRCPPFRGGPGFSDTQIELMKTFAEQAVIAITGAETYRALQTSNADLRQSLEYQTATSDVLKVISRSRFDLKPVLEAVLLKAARLCDAEFGVISTREGDAFRVGFVYSNSPEYRAILSDRLLPADRGTVIGRTAVEGRIVHIMDISADPDYAIPQIRKKGGARTCLGVPLLREGVVVGVISLARHRVEAFSEQQIELVSTFADQAVIAIENTRLITEQREALEQQTATTEVLQVINSSPGNLVPVFDAMLERAMRLCGIAFGMMTTFERERFHPVCWRGLPKALSNFFAEGGGPSGSSGMHAQILGGAPLVYVADMKDEEAYRSGHPARRALVDLGGARTGLAIALRKEGVLLATFMLYCQEVRSFSDKEIPLLRSFGAQAVIAMENARLLNEQREALEQQTATAEVLQVINASPGELRPVFDAVLEKALRLCRAAFGMLGTYDGVRFQWVARHGLPDWTPGGVIIPEPGGALERIAKGEGFVHIPDLIDTDAYRDGVPSRIGLVHRSGARAGPWVGLRKEGTVMGVILIYRREPSAFSDKQIALLQNFAAQAVIAMDNARLLSELREALEQQTATAEVLQVINSSPGDLTPVFDAMLDRARKLCGADVGTFCYRDGSNFRVVASSAPGDTGRTVTPAPGTSLDRIAHGSDVVQIDDVTKEEGYRTGVWMERTQRVGTRTALAVPLRKDDELVGAITTGRREVSRFAENQIGLLRSFAAQAVIAIENARLLDEIRQRQAELRVTFDNMGDGVVMFDAEHRLAASNRNFQELLDIPEAAIAKRLSYADYLRLLAERGEFGVDDIEGELARRLGDTDRELRLERIRPDGRVIEVRRNPVLDGGFVLIYSDISERKRSEAEIRAARDAAEALHHQAAG